MDCEYLFFAWKSMGKNTEKNTTQASGGLWAFKCDMQSHELLVLRAASDFATCHSHVLLTVTFGLLLSLCLAIESLLAVSWGYQDEQCLAALVEFWESLEGQCCRRDLPGLLTWFSAWHSSQAYLSCLVLLPGCNQGATGFLQLAQCLQF